MSRKEKAEGKFNRRAERACDYSKAGCQFEREPIDHADAKSTRNQLAHRKSRRGINRAVGFHPDRFKGCTDISARLVAGRRGQDQVLAAEVLQLHDAFGREWMPLRHSENRRHRYEQLALDTWVLKRQ